MRGCQFGGVVTTKFLALFGPSKSGRDAARRRSDAYEALGVAGEAVSGSSDVALRSACILSEVASISGAGPGVTSKLSLMLTAFNAISPEKSAAM